MRPTPGDVLGGKYRILRLIGDGGMGAVYEARHEVLGSTVALKFLHAELARRPGLATRFLQEARVSASIQSPHVTRVTDVDQTREGSPYLVMELLVGESLQQLLDRTIKLPRDQAIDFALQILSGLEAAHALGVVHRDLKPDNVFVTASSGGPVLKLLDFGIAKLRESSEYQKGLTRPGAVMGTPEYMAPEQLYAADKVDHRADLYSLGAILYELLTGERPAYGDDAVQIITQVAQGKVKPLREQDPTFAPGLADVVHKAIAADRDRRFASAQEMRLALAPFAGELSHAGRLAATPPPLTGPPTDAVLGAAGAAPRSGRVPPTPPLEPDTPRDSGVPPTLPPEDAPGSFVDAPTDPAFGKGATQDVPRGEIQVGIYSAPAGVPATDPGTSTVRPAFGAPVYGAAPPAPPGRRPPRPIGGAVAALVLGVLVTAGVIAAIVLVRRGREDELAPLPVDSAPPPVTLSAQGVAPDAPVDPGVPPGPVSTPAGHGGNGTPRDAGVADAAADADFPFTLPPFPSTLPPLPSTLPPLPPLPSNLPPFFPPPPPPSQ